MPNGNALTNKTALPNKLLQEDGTIIDLAGNVVTNAIDAYKNKPAIPNKVLNSDGTYSKLSDIIGGFKEDIFIVVEELPASGDEQKIYLLPDGEGGFAEYHWTGSTWDIIGTADIDLSNYFTIDETNTAIETATNTALNSANHYTDNEIYENIIQVLGGSY